ncbi:MAG: HPr(Ser) kinase/phosphatase, partial [Erysipelotrichaceae bacterium]|nr:HPr(Ser) kinase/phosphatase [Erysipelotrichaceae bacterium]
MKTIKVKDLAEQFDWEIVSGTQEALQRKVELADINRPGLELAGYFPDASIHRLGVLGEKEIRFIEEEMDEVDQRRSFEFLTSEYTPAILVTHGCECPAILIDIAKRKDFPLFKTEENTSTAIVNITNYLDECLAESIVLHGEFLRIFGVGVLITGRSGMGKSEIALEMIKRGHQIVADDRVDCYRIHNNLIGRTPELIKGYMEMRGIGVINVGRMFGIGALAEQATMQLHIELEPF